VQIIQQVSFMHIKVALENNMDGGSCAWVLDHPGVTAAGREGSEALLRVPQALVAFQGWVAKHTQESWLADLGDFDVRMVELLDPGVSPNSPRRWFESDGQPLSELELQRGLQVLDWQRADLLEMAGSFSPSELERRFEGESLSIRDILEQIAETEKGLIDESDLKNAEIFTQLAQARESLKKSLSEWPEGEPVLERRGEFWSARKLLRIAIHEERERMNDLVRLMNYF